jgi:hypothetical protein
MPAAEGYSIRGYGLVPERHWRRGYGDGHQWGILQMKFPKRPRDTNQLAKFLVDRASGDVKEEAAPKG